MQRDATNEQSVTKSYQPTADREGKGREACEKGARIEGARIEGARAEGARIEGGEGYLCDPVS
jgi:hypothetical protein